MTYERSTSCVRVLVVDDFEPFRSFVRSLLNKTPGMQVICEVGDGLEAVQKAVELGPDLILLDIGLPTLTGIEAAQQIRQLVPNAKILFLTQESSDDVVQKALGLGAQGYVVKARAGTELSPALEAVMLGKQFVGSGVTGQYSAAIGAAGILGHLASNEIVASPPPTTSRKRPSACCHEIQFYSDDRFFLTGFARTIEAALRTEDFVVLAATESHRQSLLLELQARDVDAAAAIRAGRYISVDAAEALSTFMERSGPNQQRFLSTIGELVRSTVAAAASRHKRVVVLGEMVALLCGEGRMHAAVELEKWWNELAQACFFDLYCAYPVNEELKGAPYAAICAEHSAIYQDEMVTQSA
jgi:DNA-binding NarL/FixJ family response regulator